MKKAFKDYSLKAFDIFNGRCERIRTFDPLHPMQVRYQAAPHTDRTMDYSVDYCHRNYAAVESGFDILWTKVSKLSRSVGRATRKP